MVALRLGEIPLLYVNITSWKPQNVPVCSSPKWMVYNSGSSTTIIDHNRLQVRHHVRENKRHHVRIGWSHTSRSRRVPTTEHARYTRQKILVVEPGTHQLHRTKKQLRKKWITAVSIRPIEWFFETQLCKLCVIHQRRLGVLIQYLVPGI